VKPDLCPIPCVLCDCVSQYCLVENEAATRSSNSCERQGKKGEDQKEKKICWKQINDEGKVVNLDSSY